MANTSLEREVKLTADNEIPVEQLGGPRLETRFFTSTYHDTPELLLAKCGITLRRRLERGTNAWQLKLPVDGGRQEIEALGPHAAAACNSRTGAAAPKWCSTKLARALDLAPKTSRRSGSDEEQLRSFFTEQYHAILAADPGVRLGEDPEAVHKFRVAVRRLRAVLRTAQPFLLAEWVESLRNELEWLGSVLGPLRDEDARRNLPRARRRLARAGRKAWS
jgi:inorganic triphosphatase YgiF